MVTTNNLGIPEQVRRGARGRHWRGWQWLAAREGFAARLNVRHDQWRHLEGVHLPARALVRRGGGGMRHSSEELERVAPVRSHVDVYIAWRAVRPAERQRWQLPRVCRGRERGRHASRRHAAKGVRGVGEPSLCVE